MRRIASVFKKKSSKKSDASRDTAQDAPLGVRPPPSLTGKRSRSVPTLLAPSNPAYSSSISSTASVDLRTPDDDGYSGRFPSPPLPEHVGKKRWISSWVGGRKSTSLRREASKEAFNPPPVPAPVAPPASPGRTGPSADGAASPAPRAPARTTARPSDQARHQSDDGTSSESESESDDDNDDDDGETPLSAYQLTLKRTSPISWAPPPTTRPLSAAASNLRASTTQGLAPPFSPPPLLHLPGKPLFPRSVNPPATLLRAESLRSLTHRRNLLTRLRAGPALTPAEERSIAPFAARPPGERPKRTSFLLDESAVSDAKRIGAYSRGLARWAARPCLEDRIVMWQMDDDGSLFWKRITGRPGFAVADLELSDGLELLAGLRQDAIADMPEPSAASSAASSVTNLVPPRLQTERAMTHPSPLRLEHIPQSASTDGVPSPAALSPASSKQGVRFADDSDPSESIPLGYALRQKKQREEKAQFLRQEQDRRAHDEERRKMEEERRKMEAERAEWARERAAREAEKRKLEEERRQRKLADEYAASRKRQTTQRQGFVPGAAASSEVDELGRHARRGSYGSAYGSVRDGSPLRTSQHGPPSNYAGSTDDLRSRGGSASGSQRGDASERGRRARRTSTYSAAGPAGARPPSMYPPGAAAPAVPQPLLFGMPYGAGVLEMPLLPPSAPFMSQSYGPRAHSRSGSASPARSAASSGSGSRHSFAGYGGSSGNTSPASQSSERVHRVARPAHRRQSSGGSLGARPPPHAHAHPYRLPRSDSMPTQWVPVPQPMVPVVYMPQPPHPLAAAQRRQSIIF